MGNPLSDFARRASGEDRLPPVGIIYWKNFKYYYREEFLLLEACAVKCLTFPSTSPYNVK
ncbi:hypothetical protein J2TS4_15150 [Paenibacillus sp. J2TS4]|nr:hypothetical protein J2TS4_15150 [Paenibacillus sp. J2TS4]